MTDELRTITVLLFAQAVEAAGARSVSLDLPAGATAADAWALLCEAHPGLAKIESGTAIAVNEQIVRPEAWVLNDGDTIAVIPPVSGG